MGWWRRVAPGGRGVAPDPAPTLAPDFAPDWLEREVDRARRFTAALTARFAYVDERPLAVRRVENALVTRRRHGPDDTFSGAVHDADGRLAAGTLRFNEGDIRPVDPPVLPDAAARARSARRIARGYYGGIGFPVLGHFLVETLGRFWPEGEGGPVAPGTALVLHPWPDFDVGRFLGNPLYAALLGALGVGRGSGFGRGLGRGVAVAAREDLAVDELLVPDPASLYHEYVHPVMAGLFERLSAGIAARAGEGPAALFLSRSRWGANARIAEPARLDDLFRGLGFAVVHPERTRPDRLMAALRGARVVAATDGSHAHLAAFCRPGTRTILLDTRPVPTQTAIARLRGLDAVHVPLFESPLFESPFPAGGTGGAGTLRAPDRLARLVATLRDA